VYSESTLASIPRVGSLAGLIERKHLTKLLIERAFYADLPTRAVLEQSTATEEPTRLPLRSFGSDVPARAVLKPSPATIGKVPLSTLAAYQPRR